PAAQEPHREQAERAVRAMQVSILRGILDHLDLAQLTAQVTATLREVLGYDEVSVHLGPTQPTGSDARGAIVGPIGERAVPLGTLVAANSSSARPIDPRDRSVLDMLSPYLAVAIGNSRLQAEVAEMTQSLDRLIRLADDAIISVDAEGRIRGWNAAAAGI